MFDVDGVVVFKQILTPDGFLYPSCLLRVKALVEGRKDVFELEALPTEGAQSSCYTASANEIRYADLDERNLGLRLPLLYSHGDEVLLNGEVNEVCFFVKYMSNENALLRKNSGEIIEAKLNQL